MTDDPRAGTLALEQDIVDLSKLTRAFFDHKPDVSLPAQRVSFGTSGHRGSSLDTTFNEDHIVAVTQAICRYRNSQGIDWQPGTNLLFETEHGPSGFDGPGGGDEVNILEKGKNYGWPVIHHQATYEGMESPLLEYTPACAPASGTFYRGSLFSQFKGNFFFGCLRGERIIRVVLDGRRVVSQENLLEKKYGRIRDIAEGPDGFIYFSTSNRDGRGTPASDDDRIMRLVPLK